MFALVKVKASLHQYIVSNQHSHMPHPRKRNLSGSTGLYPCHGWQVQYEKVVKKLVSIPPSEHVHLCSYNSSRVVQSSRGGIAPIRPLIPSHRYRVQSMQISVIYTVLSPSTEENNTAARQHSSMAVARIRRCSLRPRPQPFVLSYIKNYSIVQVCKALTLSGIKVATKYYKGRTYQSCCMSSSGGRWNTFYMRVCSLPGSWLGRLLGGVVRLGGLGTTFLKCTNYFGVW